MAGTGFETGRADLTTRACQPPIYREEWRREMATETYWQLLKRPEWQKKRLEALAAAGWKCGLCCDTEKTLHVHHRAYVKGRKPWEYQTEELDVLCEDCHAEGHSLKDKWNWLVRQIPVRAIEEMCGLICGFYADEFPNLDNSLDEGHEFYSAHAHEAGVLGKTALNHFSIDVVAGITISLLDAAANGADSVTIDLRAKKYS